MNKPAVLFFARGYQADFFPALANDQFDALFVTLTRNESSRVEKRGQAVAACFEADFDGIEPAPVPDDYLITSLVSDRFLGRFDPVRRMEILGKEIAFWSALLDRHKPAAVINELVAIEISEVLLIECRKRGIPYLAGMNCVIDDLFYWLPDPMTMSGSKLPAVVPDESARQGAKAYLRQVVAKDYKPFYVQNLAGRRALLPFAAALAKVVLWWFRSLRDKQGGRFTYEMYDDEYGKRVSVWFKSFFRRYDRLEAIPSDREIVFFPLHQEPEATLNYMSEFYSNQVATIENILKCLGPRQVLVVKEHPVDKGSLLRRKFWEIRSRNSGLYYLPAEVHGREVLAVADRVITLTSTVGWEAAIIGKKVYVLGEIFYDNLPGVVAIANFRDLRTALRRPGSEGRRLSMEKAEAFVAELAVMSYPGNPFPHDNLYSRTNTDRIIHAIMHAAKLQADERDPGPARRAGK